MSRQATLAVNNETKRVRIAYTLMQPHQNNPADVWLHCSKMKKNNQSGFWTRSNQYNGPRRNAAIISRAIIDKSTFVKELNIVHNNQVWQPPAQNVWEHYFGEPEQSARSLEYSGVDANATPVSDNNEDRVERRRSTRINGKHAGNTATGNLLNLSNLMASDISSIVEFDAESEKDMFMSDAEIKAAFYAQDRPMSALIIGRMANLIKIQANTVEPPPFDLVRRIGPTLVVLELWQNRELLAWRDQATKQHNDGVSDNNHDREEMQAFIDGEMKTLPSSPEEISYSTYIANLKKLDNTASGRHSSKRKTDSGYKFGDNLLDTLLSKSKFNLNDKSRDTLLRDQSMESDMKRDRERDDDPLDNYPSTSAYRPRHNRYEGRSSRGDTPPRRGRYNNRNREGSTSPRHHRYDDRSRRGDTPHRSRSPRRSRHDNRDRRAIRSPPRVEFNDRDWETRRSSRRFERSDRDRELPRSSRRVERGELDSRYH
jgi:hypothetical protein